MKPTEIMKRLFQFIAVTGWLGLASAGVQAAAIVHPSQEAGFVNTANATSPLGSNLVDVDSYRLEYPFVNFFKMARPWFSGSATEFQNATPLRVDSNGNVVSLAQGQVARAVLFDGAPSDLSLSGRTFDVFYDGEGTLAYSGAVVVVSQSPGRDVIRVATVASSAEQLTITFTLQSTNTTNRLRNIRMLPQGGICVGNPLVAVASSTACASGAFRSFADHHQRIVFNPQFLDDIKRFRSLRFMDWMRTNNSFQSQFSQRALPSHQFWSTARGVPLEVMISLSNLMNIDPWFNIPHKASDSYVASFASLMGAQLKPSRRAYIEYSNEVWNFQFFQTFYAQESAKRIGLNIMEDGSQDDFQGMLRFYSKRSQRVFDIFQSTLGGTSRIRRVMASQAANPFLTTVILSFGLARQKTDVFAIAPYFGDTIVDTVKGNELKRLGVDGIFDWLANDNNAILDYGSLPRIDRVVADQMAALAPFGIPLTSYEGGQHFLAAGDVFNNDPALDALMDTVNRDPRMKAAYTTYLNNWRNRTGQVFHHFLNSDRWGIFGRWGSKEFPTQPQANAPKYDALMNYISNRPLTTVP